METKTTKRAYWTATVAEGVPLRKREANQFAWRLRRYLEEKIVGLSVERVAFVMDKGYPVLKAYVKRERRRTHGHRPLPDGHQDEGQMVEVFEDIGGPEVRLFVNDFHVATWMTGCDRFTTDMLDASFEELAQVSMLAIIGTWDLHNETICCTKWGDEKGKTIECCTLPE